jgi:peptidoglycan/LPS O-acetylase OafA/YrhL
MMTVSIFCGWALYFFVETPFMNLRERFYPSTVRSPSFTHQQRA